MAKKTKTPRRSRRTVPTTASLSGLARLFAADASEVEYVQAAERTAPALLAMHGALMSDEHYSVIAALASELEGESVAKADARLNAIDNYLKGAKGLGNATDLERPRPWDASGAAADRWTPEINCSYYLGLALGYTLAGGGK